MQFVKNYYGAKIALQKLFPFLAWLFSKKSRGIVIACLCGSICIVGIFVQKTLAFSNISVTLEDIFLKLRLVVYYQEGNAYQ